MKNPMYEVSAEQQKAIDRMNAIAKWTGACGDNKVPKNGK